MTQTQEPFDMSAADGAAIAVAIIGVWSIAWAGKALYLALSLRDEQP